MKRLPSYDTQTSQVERAAFVGLSLVAAMLICITAADSARFASQHHQNSASISPDATALVQIKKKVSATNLTIFQTEQAAESARMNGVIKPKS